MSLAIKAARIIKYDATRRGKDLLTNSVYMNEYGGGDVYDANHKNHTLADCPRTESELFLERSSNFLVVERAE